MVSIHPTAIVERGACLGEDVTIGPYCYVGEKVSLGDGVSLKMNAIVDGYTEIGENTMIYPFASIGLTPQDRKYHGEDSRLIIGKNNCIREYVTIHPGTEQGGMVTKIGDNSLFLVGSHIAHDCMVGNYVTLTNYVMLAGHIVIEDYVTIGGLSGLSQFTRVGAYAMISGLSGVNKDVLPYALMAGIPARVIGVNTIGLKKHHFLPETITQLRKIYKILFYATKPLSLREKLSRVHHLYPDNPYAEEIISFFVSSKDNTLEMSDIKN